MYKHNDNTTSISVKTIMAGRQLAWGNLTAIWLLKIEYMLNIGPSLQVIYFYLKFSVSALLYLFLMGTSSVQQNVNNADYSYRP